MPRTYLDHASTSPVRPAALEAMVGWFRPEGEPAGADPGRIHAEGMASRVALEQAREQVAAFLGARPREVVFTSGATEAIAMASYGALERDRTGRHVVLAAVEHSAVRRWAERGDPTVVGVDRTGRVDPDELLDAVRDDTALVHVQWGNHEVGTCQPVEEVVRRCRERGVLVHVDAAQAAGRLPISFGELGADLLSVSGHKLGAPPGTGALLVRRGLRLPPLLVGGDQERARRAGMENVPALIGLGAAAEELATSLPAERARCERLAGRIVDWAAGAEGVQLLGHPTERLPHLVCLGLEGVEPQPVLLGLDRVGVAVHSGSSCSSEALEPSPVLEAMGVDAERSLRISVGWSSTDADVDRLLDALPSVIDSLRALRRSG
ncbi:MAG TPA: cysteine desulfurase family protein [Microthrixaceae bacterium]|nr:cysteine desulfurase family protein [Microthrixaceae bacterium]